jgi:hypothetical protein
LGQGFDATGPYFICHRVHLFSGQLLPGPRNHTDPLVKQYDTFNSGTACRAAKNHRKSDDIFVKTMAISGCHPKDMAQLF